MTKIMIYCMVKPMRTRLFILLCAVTLLVPVAMAQEEPQEGSGEPDLKSFGCFIVVDAKGTKDNLNGSCVKDLDTEKQSDAIDQLKDACENPTEQGYISFDCGKEKTDPAGEKYTATCTWEEVKDCAQYPDEAGGSGGTGQYGPPPFAPQQPFTPRKAANLGELITDIYNWSLGILGLGVFSMITYGGALWLTAAGNPGKIASAKSKISNALLGAVLLLSSYLILNLINPDLLTQSGQLPPVKQGSGGGAGAGAGTGTGPAGPPPPPPPPFEGGGGEFGGGGATGTF